MSGAARARSVVLGIARVARGRPDGLALFGNTPQAFLGSLAPLIAFPLVGTALMLAGGGGPGALADLLATLCGLLAPAVLSHFFARAWGREAQWPRFATAFNWCQWTIPVVAALVLVVLAMMMAAGFPGAYAGFLLVATLVAYGFWLHWFLARHGLAVSRLRALLLVICVNLGTAAVVLGPQILARGMPGVPGVPAVPAAGVRT